MTLGMDLRQASCPCWISSYGLVTSTQEVPMPRVAFVRRKAHDRGFAVAEAMRQTFSLSIFLGTVGQFATKGSSKTHGGFLFGDQRHLHNCFHTCTSVCICRGVGRRS